jgi:hypothetical protein
MEDPLKFNRLDLSITSGGKLIRRFDAGHVGAYAGRDGPHSPSEFPALSTTCLVFL